MDKHREQVGRVSGPCAECATAGRRGSCARRRCYCGHPACWAFDSWVDLRAVAISTTTTDNARMRDSWNARKDSTWIDKL